MAAATKLAQDPEVIARLQSEASRSPGMYRLRLTLIAVAGDFALMATQVLPWAAPIVLGMLWMNVVLFYWLGGAAIVLFVWLLRPSFRFEGRELTAEEAPLLYSEIAGLKKKLQVPGRMHVYLDASFNASAAETRGIFGVFGTRSALTLGIPLLLVLDRRQVLAIIAHEFGHFSRRHGRLGNWLYRARVGWLAYAEQVGESDSSFDQAAAWYARHFVPFFSARSFVHSRQCEYEADADAALAFGSDAIAEALTRLVVLGRFWDERVRHRLADWQLQKPEPPADFYERVARLCRECSSSDLKAWLDQELAAPSGWLDTHPSLSERIGSLKQTPRLVAAENCAGEQLLGGNWPKVLAEFNADWTRKAGADWRLEHLRLKHIPRPSAGLAALRELHEKNPAHQRTTFAYASALLEEDDEGGVALMEALAREDARFRVQAFLRVVAYFERQGNTRQIERWSGWLKHATSNLVEALSAFVVAAEAGQARPSSLPDGEKALIAEATELDPCLSDSWLLEGDAELRFEQNRPAVRILVHLLALAIDPGEAARRQQDEESIAKRYQDLFRTLVPPDQVPVVRTYFTTEKMPPIYQ